jgi:C4-dicarboxylate-specific signal transduction histidine kinase
MMPTHEVRRDILEALKILRRMRDSKEMSSDAVDSAISLLKQADSTVGGIGRLMQRTREDEAFELEKAAKAAVELMRYRLERNNVAYEVDVRSSRRVVGSDRLITILVVNFLDNSIYWVLRKRPEERKIKVIVDEYDNRSILVVSDSGPGFLDDDIETLSLPFFTRKPNGMGLGLYIADRIARMNGGRLKILAENELPGLLSGANIAAILPEAR